MGPWKILWANRNIDVPDIEVTVFDCTCCFISPYHRNTLQYNRYFMYLLFYLPPTPSTPHRIELVWGNFLHIACLSVCLSECLFCIFVFKSNVGCNFPSIQDAVFIFDFNITLGLTLLDGIYIDLAVTLTLTRWPAASKVFQQAHLVSMRYCIHSCKNDLLYRCRNQVLSNEIKALKKQVPQLLQKNEHDNELIEALMVGNDQLQLDLSVKNTLSFICIWQKSC